LIELQELVQEFNASDAGQRIAGLYDNQIKVEVPKFLPINGNIIAQHLDENSPKWRDGFHQFAESFNNQENKNNLGKETVIALERLQGIIRECFEKNPLSEETITQFLADSGTKADDLFMIRSTGIHEDKADLANPGGNESLPSKANIDEISKAIGEVAASYIGPKSLSQRLIAGDLNITEFPVMPVLVQKMVGSSKEAAVMSGVVYSGNGSSRIQAAPGHGELVVNSKGAVDNYYISNQDIVYAEVRPKEFRLSPVLDEASGKIKLERVENPGKLQYASALNEPQALYLHEFGKFLEDKYNKRMDIEFVYDMDSKSINVVQARAIPEGSRKTLEPSALSPEFLSKNKLEEIKAGQVITPEVNKAAVITDLNQVIIAQTIEEALSKYNGLGKDAGIRGVIVQNPAPDTSHEAGAFNSSAISVMQVADIERAKALFASSQPIVMDPQHCKIYQLPESIIKTEGKTADAIEKQLYDNGILAKGIYASSLSSFVTPISHALPKVDKHQNAVPDLTGTSLGALLQKAKSGNIDSTKDLLAIAHVAMSFGQGELNVRHPELDSGSNNKEGSRIKSGMTQSDKAALLHQNLALLSAPKIGENNSEAKVGLGYVLRALTDGHKKGIVSKDLFKQSVMSGAELHILLDNLAQKQNLTKEEKDKAYLQYFNGQKKFEGLILGEGESLANSLFNNKYAKMADELIGKFYPGAIMEEKQREAYAESTSYLIESLKLSDYFLNDKSKANWQEFCAKTCASPEDAQKLGNLVSQVVGYNAHSKWVNVIFTDAYDKERERHPEPNRHPAHHNRHPELDLLRGPSVAGSNKRILDKLDQAFKEIDLSSIEQARKTIKTMESEIPLWADPAKFAGLHKELQENIGTINEVLQNPTKTQLDQDIQQAINDNTRYAPGQWHYPELGKLYILLQERLERTVKDTDLVGYLSNAIKLIDKESKLTQALQDRESYKHEEFTDKEFANVLSRINRTLAFDPDGSTLKKLIITAQYDQLVEVVDQSIKSFTKSTKTPGKQEAINFGKMVSTFYSILHPLQEKTVTSKRGAEFMEEIKAMLEYKHSLPHLLKDREEFVARPKFDVRNFNILDDKKESYFYYSRDNTFEEYFTSIHQNAKNVIAHIQDNLYKDYSKQLPPLMQVANQELNNIRMGKKVFDISNTIDFTTKDLMIVQKNITLRGHSATVGIIYNIKNKETYINFLIHGANEYKRWDHIVLDSTLNLTAQGIKCISSPYHDVQKDIVSFKVKVNNKEQIPLIKEIIEQSIQTSFDLDILLTFKLFKAHEELVSQNPALKTKINDLYPITKFDPTLEKLNNLLNQKPDLLGTILYYERNGAKPLSSFLETQALTLDDITKCPKVEILKQLIEGKISAVDYKKQVAIAEVATAPPSPTSPNGGTWTHRVQSRAPSPSPGPSK
jgi:Pyruvate phosphate dikinase, AMP/ATP-binding domain